MDEMPAPLDISQQYDHAWRTLLLGHDIIKSFDYKIQLLVALAGFFWTYAFPIIGKERPLLALKTQGPFPESLCLWLLVLGFFMFLGAVAFSLAARRRKRHDNPVLARLIFFRDVLGHGSPQAYRDRYLKASATEALEDVLFQVWEVGHIARAKHRGYDLAWTALLLQVLVFVMYEYVAAG